MKYIKLIIALLFVHSISNAQEYRREFGRVSQEEIDLKEYSLDNSAEAIVLFDLGKSYFIRSETGFEVGYEKTTRIKVLTEAGIKWAEVEIPFYHEGTFYEKVIDIEAYTFNYDNNILKITPLDLTTVYDEKVNNYWSLKKFAMPNVKVGSIVDIKYRIISQYLFNLRNWAFQWKIPVVYSEYIVNMIPFYSYSWLLQGANKFTSTSTEEDRMNTQYWGSTPYYNSISKYIMKNIPAFKDEEYITSINDYIIKMDFQLAKIFYPTGGTVDVITTWPALIKELNKDEDFGKYVTKSQKVISKLLKPDTLLNKPAREKFNDIMNYVKRNFNWNKTNSKYASKSPDGLIKDKYGNCADINLFTVGLLNAAGIEAYPVLISTRENGKIKYNYPYLNFFNYVLIAAKIDGNTILADATEPFCQNDRIPPRCINDKGLVVTRDKDEWVSLQCPFVSEQNTDMKINIINDLLEANIAVSANEYQALYYRKTYGTNDSLLKADFKQKDYDLKESALRITNPVSMMKPYILDYKINYKKEEINNKIYISPFLNEPMSVNPLIESIRTYPIDMTYPLKKAYYSTINIPEGYKADFLPAVDEIKNDNFELNYHISNDDNTINVSFDYTFRKSVYPPSEYSNIKYYLNEIVKKANEKVVLVKK